MWVPRNPDEVTKWNQAAEQEARSEGLMIGIGTWVVATPVLSAGWIVSFHAGIALPGGFSGTFWSRLPVFALVTLPFAFVAFSYERKKALKKALDRTICPKCDLAGDCNAGAVCACGGAFIAQSAMKWVE
jgi:hypothetical protein